MDSGLYTACSGLVAQMRALELAAQDLANVNTNAYRGQRVSFQSLLAQNSGYLQNAATQAVNQHGVIGPTSIDISPGQLQRTGAPLDVAIEGSGFFAIEGPNGVEYTRNGNFHASAEGYLVTDSGLKVLGQSAPLRVINGDMSVSEDGTISVNGAVAGKLRLVEFDQPSQLTHLGGANFTAPSNSARPAINSRVRQGMLEGSNVNGISAAVGLIALQRHAEMLQRAMSAFHSELNRSAVEELPRI